MLWKAIMEQLMKPIEKLNSIELQMKQNQNKIKELSKKDNDIIEFLNVCIDFLLWEKRNDIPPFYPNKNKIKVLVRDIYNDKHRDTNKEEARIKDYIEWEKRTNIIYIRIYLLYKYYLDKNWIKENKEFNQLEKVQFNLNNETTMLEIFTDNFEKETEKYVSIQNLSLDIYKDKYTNSIIHIMQTKIDGKQIINICHKLRVQYISFIKSHLPEFKIYKDDKYGIMSFARLIESKSDENFNKHTLHVSAFASKVESDKDELYEFQWFLLGFDDVEHVSNWLSGTKNIVTQTMLKVPYLDTHERILNAKDRKKLKNIYKKHGEYLNEELRKKIKDNKEVHVDDEIIRDDEKKVGDNEIRDDEIGDDEEKKGQDS